MSKAVITDSEDNNNRKKHDLPAELQAPQLITIPNSSTNNDIDMNLEVAMLDCALRRMCALVAMEESLKETSNVISMARAACDVANTIKYLKSDHIYHSPTTSGDNDIFGGFGFMPFIDMDDEDD